MALNEDEPEKGMELFIDGFEEDLNSLPIAGIGLFSHFETSDSPSDPAPGKDMFNHWFEEPSVPASKKLFR